MKSAVPGTEPKAAEKAAESATTARFRILNSEFFRTYVDLKKLPESLAPEIAFIGRSNAGKSSLLNALLERRDLARTSQTPGKTQSLNYFSVSWAKGSGEEQFRDMSFFVDLPGYGYAKVAKSLRKTFYEFVDGYVSTRKQLRAVVLVCDSRREAEEEEEYIGSVRRDIPLFLVATKVDKLSKNELAASRQRWTKFAGQGAQVFCCSAKDRTKFDLPSLRQIILQHCAGAGPDGKKK